MIHETTDDVGAEIAAELRRLVDEMRKLREAVEMAVRCQHYESRHYDEPRRGTVGFRQ